MKGGGGMGGMGGGGRGGGPRAVPDQPLDLRVLVRLFHYTRPYARTRNWLVFFVVLRAIQLPLLAWFVGAIIGGPITAGNIPTMTWAIGGFFLFALVTDFCFHFRARLAQELGESVVHDLRQEVFEHVHRMPMSYFIRTRRGSIISRITSDIEALRGGVQSVLWVSLVQAGQGLIAAGLMLWIDPVLFLIIVGMVPLLWVLNRVFTRKISRATREVQASFSRVTSSVAESVSGIRVTQGFAREATNAGIFQRLIADHSRYNMNMARASAVFIPLLDLNTQLFTALLLLFGGYRVLNPAIGMPADDLIQFLFLANLALQPIQTIGNMYNQALIAMSGAERVFTLLDMKPDWTDAPGATAHRIEHGTIVFEDVSFGYDEGQRVLKGISFTAPEGTCTALVGPTGSGKSTVLNLLAKFYLPGGGRLLVDGTDYATITTASLHHQLGIVQQRNFLFSMTVLDNIRFAKPEAGEDEVRKVLDDLGSLDLVESLPQGLHTLLSEGGASLSLGQRQVICFARALMADPRILLLDEATSSVDALTELRLQNALAILMQGRTSFVVAHRLSTIRRADQVLFLSQGEILERGSHTDLLKQNGHYAELYRQFARMNAGA